MKIWPSLGQIWHLDMSAEFGNFGHFLPFFAIKAYVVPILIPVQSQNEYSSIARSITNNSTVEKKNLKCLESSLTEGFSKQHFSNALELSRLQNSATFVNFLPYFESNNVLSLSYMLMDWNKKWFILLLPMVSHFAITLRSAQLIFIDFIDWFWYKNHKNAQNFSHFVNFRKPDLWR